MTDNQRIDQHILDKYKILKKLGSGAYGHVWKITAHQKHQEIYALKKVFQAFQHCTDAQRTFREISILKKIEHPNIIKLYEVLPSLSERDVYLVFQFMNTDLYHVIYDGVLEEIHKKYILYQLLLGLHYLHSARLIHRDLKPSNLLLSQQCQLKICDFGLVRFLGSKEQDVVLTEGVATRWYRAPEVLLGSKIYDQKVDMWSVGCILAEIVLKNPLFNCNSTMAQVQKIIQIIGRPSSEDINQIGSQITESIIKQCGSVRQKSAKQIFGSNADQNCIDLIYNLLRFRGSKRFSALQALRHPYLRQFFRQTDVITFKGEIVMETDDNVKLTTDQYKQLISKKFFERKQPQRFSDLRKGQKSFGKVLGEINSRKASGQKDTRQKTAQRERKNVHLFQQLLREKQSSVKCSRISSNSRAKMDKQNTKGQQNIIVNRETKPVLEKFSTVQKNNKNPGTFAALRKVNATTKFNK